MPGLQESQWASQPAASNTPKKDPERHVEVPYFGFTLPPRQPATPQKTATPVFSSMSSSPPASPSTPTPAAKEPRILGRPITSPTPTHDFPTKSEVMVKEQISPAKDAPFKFMSRADIAAAATRARMAEIMGPPRRRLGQTSGAPIYAKQESMEVKEDVEMGDAESPRKAKVEKGDVEMSLLD